MATDIRGLIIPRSYNEYINKSVPADIRDAVKLGTDAELSAISEQPLQNKVLAALMQNDVSAENQLTTVDFVNSTVGTNTANYIYKTTSGGQKVPFDSIAELEAYAGTVTNNDYAFVTGTDAAGNVYFDRYKADVDGAVVSWAKEYRLNNSSFTSAQWAAINSGITSELLAVLEAQANSVSYVPQTLTAQQQKQARQNIGIDLQAVFNVCHPIGETYVQYPTITDMIGVTRNTVDPMTLYNVNGVTSTWVELNYDGAFFRADGGNANVFDAGIQDMAIQSHSHNIGIYSTSAGASRVSAYNSGTYQRSVATENTGGNETRPKNYTIKIWQRTA